MVDADGVVLGRLASEVAHLLRGKHKPNYTTHLNNGDHVVVVNAQGVMLTGRKPEQKIHYHYSGYPGGMSATPYGKLLQSQPAEVIRRAVRGMLPKTRLGRRMLTRLKVYTGAEHPHVAQQPASYVVKSSRRSTEA
jgi:large subunit ribosomal protein L13